MKLKLFSKFYTNSEDSYTDIKIIKVIPNMLIIE